MDQHHIGQSIKRLRKEAGLSQERVAERLGVTSQAVSKWEVGQASPDIALLRPIADFFGVTMDVLFAEAEPPNNDSADPAAALMAAGYAEVSLEQRFGIFREGLKAAPRNTNLLADAIGTGYLLAKTYLDARDKRANAYFEDTVSLCKRQMAVSHDVNELNYAKFYLALLYAMFGRSADAEEIARQFPPFGSTVTSGAVKTAVKQTSGSTAEEIEARIENLEQMMLAAANEVKNIKTSYARLLSRGNKEDEMNDNNVWKADITQVDGSRSQVAALLGDSVYYYAFDLGSNAGVLRRYDLTTREDGAVYDFKETNPLFGHIGDMRPVGDTLWAEGTIAADETHTSYKWVLVRIAGLPDDPAVEYVEIPEYADAKLGSYNVDRNGNICLTFDEAMAIEADSPARGRTTIVLMARDGKVLREIKATGDDIYYSGSKTIHPENKSYPNSGSFVLADGRVAFLRRVRPTPPAVTPVQLYVVPVNPASGEWDEPIALDLLSIRSSPMSGFCLYTGYGKHLFFYIDQNAYFRGFNTETGASDRIFSCVDVCARTEMIIHADYSADPETGEDCYRILSVAPVSQIFDMKTYRAKFEIAAITRQPDIDGRIPLTFGTGSFNFSVMQPYITAFNRANKEYRIDAKPEEVSAQDLSTGKSSEFMAQLLAGDAPDIMYLDLLPHELFTHRGIFADLYQFIDADDRISRDSFQPWALKLLETDGKLPCLTNSVILFPLLGQRQTIGPDLRMTYDGLRELMDAHPGATAVYDATNTYVLSSFLMENMDDFIDWRTGETRFTDGAYESLLELCSRFPANPEDPAMYSLTDKPIEDALRDGETLMGMYQFLEFAQVREFRETMGDDFAVKAYPSREGSGIPATAMILLGISESCAHKDAAWQFVRGVIRGELDVNTGISGFPVLKDDFEKRAEDAMKRGYIDLPDNYDDLPPESKEYYDKLERDDSGRILRPEPIFTGRMWGQGRHSIFSMSGAGAVTRDDIDFTLSLLENAGRLPLRDSSLQYKIVEEAKLYFAGEKSAREVAEATDAIVRAHYKL